MNGHQAMTSASICRIASDFGHSSSARQTCTSCQSIPLPSGSSRTISFTGLLMKSKTAQSFDGTTTVTPEKPLAYFSIEASDTRRKAVSRAHVT